MKTNTASFIAVILASAFIFSGCGKNPEESFQQGIEQYNSGRLKEAISSLSYTVDIEPENVQARFYLGMSYKKTGDIKRALEHIDYCRQLNPEDFFILHNLADCYFQLKNYDQSLKWIRESLKIKPDFLDSHLLLGAALFKSGKTEPALEELLFLTKITEKENDSYIKSQSKFMLAELYIQESKYQESISLLKNLLEDDPASPVYIYYLGLAYSKINDQEKLKEQIAKLESINSPLAKDLKSLVK